MPFHALLTSSPLVFDQGEEGEAFYAVLEGEAHVLRTHDDGEVETLTTLGPGHCFGERARGHCSSFHSPTFHSSPPFPHLSPQASARC